jgi:hypothetical protein
MVDDHDLMRMACSEFRKVLDTFKAWHLSYRVPALWQERPPPPPCTLRAQESVQA